MYIRFERVINSSYTASQIFYIDMNDINRVTQKNQNNEWILSIELYKNSDRVLKFETELDLQNAFTQIDFMVNDYSIRQKDLEYNPSYSLRIAPEPIPTKPTKKNAIRT